MRIPGGRPTAPTEIRDAAENWARGQGRHADVVWIDSTACFGVKIDLHPQHPQNRLWREGKLQQSEPPTETVLLREWNNREDAWRNLRLEDLGPSGVVRLLEKADVMSGRGEYPSLVAAAEAHIQENARVKEEASQRAYDMGREIGAVGRRRELGLPQVGVISSLSPKTPTPEVQNASS